MTVVYSARPDGAGEEGVKAATSLEAVISKHQLYIENTTKGPIVPYTPSCDLSAVTTKEEQKVPAQYSGSGGGQRCGGLTYSYVAVWWVICTQKSTRDLLWENGPCGYMELCPAKSSLLYFIKFSRTNKRKVTLTLKCMANYKFST